MLWLALGGAALFLLLGGLRAFERASVRSIKMLLAWIAALAGLTVAVLLLLSGRAGTAIWALAMFGPLLWQKWKASRPGASGPGAGGAGAGGFSGFTPPPRQSGGAMTRDEAYAVLGLRPGATETEIRDAHRRLMRGAHPDHGGSDWLASRVNQARDVLLG